MAAVSSAGAVYSPSVLIVPTVLLPPSTPLTLHVAAVSPAAKVNCFVAPRVTTADPGERVTNGSLSPCTEPPDKNPNTPRAIIIQVKPALFPIFLVILSLPPLSPSRLFHKPLYGKEGLFLSLIRSEEHTSELQSQ